MQHDTSPYCIRLGDTPTKLIASLLYLRYSKRRYLEFFRVFNRFRMKCFLHKALMFWRYAAAVCIIDNTNLARLRGTGRNAVIVPEMEAFAKEHGFRFVCHEKGHANRKAGEERSFWTVETNFLPGRHFSSLEDLNQQAFEWATVRMEHRPVAKTGLIPAQAFEQERTALVTLPAHLPAPYLCHERKTDQYGYVPFDGNYYWIPSAPESQERRSQSRDVRARSRFSSSAEGSQEAHGRGGEAAACPVAHGRELSGFRLAVAQRHRAAPFSARTFCLGRASDAGAVPLRGGACAALWDHRSGHHRAHRTPLAPPGRRDAAAGCRSG